MINIDDILLNVLNVLRVLFIDRMGLYVVGVGLDNQWQLLQVYLLEQLIGMQNVIELMEVFME